MPTLILAVDPGGFVWRRSAAMRSKSFDTARPSCSVRSWFSPFSVVVPSVSYSCKTRQTWRHWKTVLLIWQWRRVASFVRPRAVSVLQIMFCFCSLIVSSLRLVPLALCSRRIGPCDRTALLYLSVCRRVGHLP